MGQLNFKDVFQSLFQKERRITYQSLTSNKKHSRIVTIPRKFQSYGDKIVVWDVELDKIWTRHIAFSKIITSLPLGFYFLGY